MTSLPGTLLPTQRLSLVDLLVQYTVPGLPALEPAKTANVPFRQPIIPAQLRHA